MRQHGEELFAVRRIWPVVECQGHQAGGWRSGNVRLESALLLQSLGRLRQAPTKAAQTRLPNLRMECLLLADNGRRRHCLR